MSNKYKSRTEKKIELPSGATCVIRQLLARDFISVGQIPVTISDKPAGREASKEPTSAEAEWASKLGELILLKCVSNLQFEGEKLTIVKKPWGDCADDEVSYEKVEDADSVCIVTEVLALSNMTKEVGQEAQKFRAESEAVGISGPDGGTLRQAAE